MSVQYKELRGDLPYAFFIAGNAAGTDLVWPLFVAPWPLLIRSVVWVPGAAVTASGTLAVTLSVRNRGPSNAGTAVPASRSYAATNSVANTPETLTLSSTATDLQFAAGDVLTAETTHLSTGMVLPAGSLVVTFRGR